MDVIDLFRPPTRAMSAQRWEAVGPTIRAWVARAPGRSPFSARSAMRVTSAFVGWCLDQDVPLDPELMLTPERVEAWVLNRDEVSTAAMATYRSHLRRIGIANTRAAPWRPPQKRLSPNPHTAPPYTAGELVGFWAAIESQATADRSHALRAMLSFGLGAGLVAGELGRLKVAHIHPHPGRPDVVVCDLPDRQVPVHIRYRDQVIQVREDSPGPGLLPGAGRKAQDPLGGVARGIEIPAYLPPLRMSRLRTTWIVNLLTHGVRISEVAQVSGLRSARGFEQYLRYVPVRGEDDLLDWVTGLAGAAQPKARQSGM